jgi:hypothetical protein
MLYGINASNIKAALLQVMKLIIWDKVPIQYWLIVESVVRCLQNLTEVNSTFGGISVLYGGNCAQI